MVDPATVVATVLVEFLRRSRFRIGFGPVGVELSLWGNQSVDERLQKIESAREGLAEALEAIDDLKRDAERNKKDLANLDYAIAEAHRQKTSLASELSALRDIATMDGDTVRRALGLPTLIDIWRDRIIAFFFGVLASVGATAIWVLVIERFVLPSS